MKRIFILFLFLMSMISASAVSYYSVGSNAEFCVYRFDGEYFLILSFKDDGDNRLTDKTIVKFKLKDGKVITLNGFDGSKKTKQAQTWWGNNYKTEEEHYAFLLITQEEIEMLKEGVDKVAINTVPEVYSRSRWSGKESFGKNLYEAFKNHKDEFDE